MTYKNETHADWLQPQLKKAMSPFGVEVANILGAVYRGLYHLPWSAYLHERTKWDHEYFIELILPGELATWDGNELTYLLVLCHDHCIRLGINAQARRYLRLTFRKRDMKSTSIYDGHPSIEDQIKNIRKGFFADDPLPREVLNEQV